MNNKSNGVIRRFFFLLPIITLFIIGCFNITSGNTPREWTILIYMAADNGLNDRAVEDILQMKEAEFSEECNIIVQVDYSQSNSYEGAKRYQIFPDDATQLAALGEIDSGNFNKTKFNTY
ncbi:MAG: hypothetical protein SVM86_00575 [Candidatus Cloacimonadota bacterium]|nr:hypothetical protein [Candidatus Cloacimonadota bacterium]